MALGTLLSLLGVVFGAMIINTVLEYTGTMDYLYLYLNNMFDRGSIILNVFYKPLLSTIPTDMLLWLLIVPIFALLVKIVRG